MNPKILLSIRFGPLHRRVLYVLMTGTWLSGGLWLLYHHFNMLPGEFGLMPHPLEKWWLRTHGLFVFTLLIGIGSVLPVHARVAWAQRKNRATGLIMQTILLWLALTGYALYYFSSTSNAGWLPILHWSAGLLLPALLFLHIRRGRHRSLAPPIPAAPRRRSRLLTLAWRKSC